MAEPNPAKTADPFEGPAIAPDALGAFDDSAPEVHDVEPTDAQVGAAVRAFLRALDRVASVLLRVERSTDAELRETVELVNPAAARAMKRAGPAVWLLAAVLGVAGLVAGKVVNARGRSPASSNVGDDTAAAANGSAGPLGRRVQTP